MIVQWRIINYHRKSQNADPLPINEFAHAAMPNKCIIYRSVLVPSRNRKSNPHITSLLPQALNLRLDPFPHWLQCRHVLIDDAAYALEYGVLNLLHLAGIVLHIWRHHVLRLIVALHHGPAKTVLELIDFLLIVERAYVLEQIYLDVVN